MKLSKRERDIIVEGRITAFIDGLDRSQGPHFALGYVTSMLKTALTGDKYAKDELLRRVELGHK